MGSIAHVEEEKKELLKDVHRLSRLGVRLMKSSLVVDFKKKQDSDPIWLELKGAIHNQRVQVFSQEGDGVLHYHGRLCIHDVGELRQHILAQSHNTTYFIHISATKMYDDLREVYWWNGMNSDIADFVNKWLN